MANIVLKPRKWQNKGLLFKPEVTYGLDATPTGAANWIEARNVQLVPMETEKVERNIDLPYMGSSGSIVTGQWAKLSFDVAVAPSGTPGVAPKIGPLLRACGWAETITVGTSVAYNLISNDFESATGYMNIDGVLHALVGVRGESKCKMAAKGIGMFSFSFDGIFVTPVAGAMPVVSRDGWTIEEGINSKNSGAVSIDGVDLAFSTFDWGQGNKIARINLPGPQLEVSIDGRAPQASVTVLAPPLGVFDPFSLTSGQRVVTFKNVHGSVLGKKFQTEMQVRIANPEYDKIEEMVAYKLTLEPVPVDGNDEIVLTFL